MNTYFNTTDENFEIALRLAAEEIPHNRLFNMLENGNIPEKQIAALKITQLNSKHEAEILLSNLIGQDGKIREAVSIKINEFMSNPDYAGYFQQVNACNIFLEAITDINGNICRNIINAVSKLKNSQDFSKFFCEKLLNKIWNLIDLVKQFDLKDGKYKVNKEVFKLYWCLETLYEFANQLDLSELKPIIYETSKINDYTIREKTAKILTLNFNNPELQNIRLTLKNDPNYYVRRY